MLEIKYLYLFMEIILYVTTGALFFAVFSRYRFNKSLEDMIEPKRRTLKTQLIFFLGAFFAVVVLLYLVWARFHRGDPHHAGYFTSFLVGGLLTLAFFKDSLPRVDLALCMPSMGIVWILLLLFESILLHYNAGWVYTDSTVLMINLPGNVTLILENLIFFYVFSPYMSIVIFTGLSRHRSDKVAFWMTVGVLWLGGAVWEVISMGIFNLWFMVEERSVLAFDLFGARTTLEEMLYYVPFAAISILIYLSLFYRKYHYYASTSVPAPVASPRVTSS